MEKRIGIIILLLAVVGTAAAGVRVFKSSEVIFTYGQTEKGESNKDDETETVVREVEEITGKAKGKYAFWVGRFDGGVGYGWNENEPMPLASIIKVPIMATALKAADEGVLSLNKVYTVSGKDVREGSSYPAGSELTLEKALREAGIRSDNTAAAMLVRLTGEEKVKKMLAELGMPAGTWENKEASAKETGEMWRKLFEENILKEKDRKLLWGYLTDSIYEERITLGVGDKSGWVIHKVGTDLDVWADAGIVFDRKGEKPVFILVIMNREISRTEGEKLVPEITRIIGDFEFKKADDGL